MGVAAPDDIGAADCTEPGKCNARTRRGGRCKQPAGHGTAYNTGPCAKHGGHLPGPKKAAAKRGLALEALRLGLSVEMEPEDLMLNTVHFTAGALGFAIREANAIEPHELATDAARIAQARLADALDRSARVSKMAMDAGISDRRIRLAQRWGESIASVIEDAMREMAEFFPPEVRTKFAQRIQAGMARLERGEIEAGAE